MCYIFIESIAQYSKILYKLFIFSYLKINTHYQRRHNVHIVKVNICHASFIWHLLHYKQNKTKGTYTVVVVVALFP